MENANPVVLNPTDLPTRRGKDPKESKKTVKKTHDSALRDILVNDIGFVPCHYEESEEDLESEDDSTIDPIDELEIYDLISTISDPEHPLSLGQLAVVNLADIHITPSPCLPQSTSLARVLVELTPTITHCSLALVIGLGVRVRLEQALPPKFRVDIKIKEGTHSQEEQTNKQLNDKERVAAALENSTLMGVIAKMLETCA